ncbi:hypothetical protein CAPTEDRAFT_169631 [Capitella teleta]|uniref:Phosphodiesterase n=1 Tax=Capitella teleta TaxID=283909 RepID=R7UJV1_CAPTE|nr:hypothetical protein CAPTEDRAFT_169631 [Capitella teleta]|eukprot:ELU06480.1 hypothetical protein CAPTEDRAFT_169631 [Capitella teleta]
MNGQDVELWLDSNPDWFVDYVIRKSDCVTINKWLRRESCSQDSSDPSSPNISSGDSGFFTEKCEFSKHQRTNSKKCLRQDFARSKMKSIFRTHEASMSVEKEASLAERRSSLKGMRQFLSLPPTSGSILSMAIQSRVRLPRYASKDEEHKKQLRAHNERDFFLEIVKDISHGLDMTSLTSRILVNISILLNADRSSLFFVDGHKSKKSLVSKVFDIYAGTNCFPAAHGNNMVRVPWGEGIIGHVAETGNAANVRNACQDPRYNDDVDCIMGYRADCLLCMPIFGSEGEVIGVAQVVNKHGRSFFTTDDEKLLETYLAFCGMAFSNAQALEAYTREYEQNKTLLEVVHDLFEEQTSVDDVVMKIMQRAQSLLQCERCVVLLKDAKENSATDKTCFGRVFDLHHSQKKDGSQCRSSTKHKDFGRSKKIAELVAATGETVNIPDAEDDGRFQVNTEHSRDFHTKSLLCKPIRNSNFQIIGVAQVINKIGGSSFDENDQQLFEAFTIYCGLGINNCLLYDKVAAAAAQQAVALEVLSYHATVPTDDVDTFKCKPIPSANQWGLASLKFNDFSLNTDEMILAGIRIFKDTGLLKTFSIEYETLVRWLLTVRKNYRNIAYHNWRHAFNVTQYMFTMINACGIRRHLSDKELLALIVGCLCHDLDHRGTNNAFQQKSSSPLSQLYGTQATLEHHHFNHAVIILNSEGHNIFSKMKSDDYGDVMNLLKQAILATDLSIHVQVRCQFFPLVASGLYDWDDPEQRELLRSVLMTTCDIATITKPWDVQRRVADLVVTEFLDQGDKEKTMLKIQPQAFMDREKQDELPRLQLEWIDGICLPLYKTWQQLNPQLLGVVDQVVENRSRWAVLDEQRLAKTMCRQTEV